MFRVICFGPSQCAWSQNKTHETSVTSGGITEYVHPTPETSKSSPYVIDSSQIRHRGWYDQPQNTTYVEFNDISGSEHVSQHTERGFKLSSGLMMNFSSKDISP